MRPRFLLFLGLISLVTCARPNPWSRSLSTDGVGRSLLRSPVELNSYEMYESECSSTATSSTRSRITVNRDSENTPLELSLSMYSYSEPNCDSDKYMMMRTRVSLSPKNEVNQYQGNVISTTFTIFGVMTSTVKCSSVVTDGVVYNVDAVHCEDANGENPFAKVTGIAGRTYTLSLRPTEKGIQINDALLGIADVSFAKIDSNSVQTVDASVGKSGSKPGPKPKPHPHPHPHPSGGGGEGGLDTEAVWIILGILGVVILIAIIAAVVNCYRSSDNDDASLMNNDYHRGDNNNNGYYDGYDDGYRDGEWDRSSSGGDDGGDGGGYDGGCDGGGDCGGD